jgi:hypothetical protein
VRFSGYEFLSAYLCSAAQVALRIELFEKKLMQWSNGSNDTSITNIHANILLRLFMSCFCLVQVAVLDSLDNDKN